MSLVRSALVLAFFVVLGLCQICFQSAVLPEMVWAQVAGCVPTAYGLPFTDGCLVPAAGLTKIASHGGYVSGYGADLTGAADSTVALNDCLAGVGLGNTCLKDPGAKLKISDNITIPANTTLDCMQTFSDRPDPINYNQMPAIMLDGGHTISAGGSGATIRNCLIYRNGMTFPAANSNGFTGIAVSDAGWGNFTLENTQIIGFDTCLYITGGRPYLNRWMFDCNGVAKASIELDNGNTDSGVVLNGKLQPMAALNAHCAASVRAGTGLRVGGTNGGTGVWLDNIVSQNFRVSDYDFLQSTLAGKLWADVMSTELMVAVTTGIASASG